MSVTPHPKYKDHWIIIYYPDGRGKDPKTGKQNFKKERIVQGPCTYEVAKIYEQELVRKRNRGASTTARIDPKLLDSYIEFCSWYKLKVSAKTFRDFESAWTAHLLPTFGALRYTQITPTQIDRFKQSCLSKDKPLKPKTINKLLTYLSAYIKWASRPEVNHSNKLQFKIEGFSANQTAPPPKMIPTPQEVQKLIDNLPKDNRGALCTVMYYGGLRLGDANSITRKQVNLEAGYMVVIGKGSKQRVIPLTPELKAVIEPRMKTDYYEQRGKGKRWENNTEYLWPNLRTQEPFDDIQKIIDTTCKQLGITKRITHHTLRHAFGTHMVMAGANLRSIQMLMGHSSVKTTEIYTTLVPDFLATEMLKISRS